MGFSLIFCGQKCVVHGAIGHQAFGVDLEGGQHHVAGIVAQDRPEIRWGFVHLDVQQKAPPPVRARYLALACGSRLGLMVPARTPSSMYCSALSIILCHNIVASSPPDCMLRTR